MLQTLYFKALRKHLNKKKQYRQIHTIYNKTLAQLTLDGEVNNIVGANLTFKWDKPIQG